MTAYSREAWLARLGETARARGVANGHDIGPWEKDTMTSRVAECAACGLYLCVNISKGEPRYYGSVYEIPCSGRLLSAPAWDPNREMEWTA